jgi:TRAP-type mannitol/chloroaromatic compound transport system substrate-binding protein
MKSWKGLMAQTYGREPGEFTRVRVARYCASQLPWITGAIRCSVLKSLLAMRDQTSADNEGPPRGAGSPPAANGLNSGFTPNVGMAIRNRMFHADHRPHDEGRMKNQQGRKSMKRREFLKVTGIGAAGAATLAAPAIAQTMPEIKWRMTTSWPKSLDTIHGGAEMMAKAVGEATDNKFQIQTFAAGEIVPGLQVLDAVQNGTVEMGHTASYYYFGKDPTFTFGSALPFGPNARLNQAWYMLGGGKDLLNEFYKSYNVTSMLAGNTTCQMGGWFRKEIKTVDDLKGLKFRIGGFAGRVMQKLGCVPQQLAGGDIYPALEKGTIDAAEWVGPYDDEKLGFNKVAPYYYYPGWWEGGPMLLAMVNLEKWNALPKYYQNILEQAGHLANNWMMAKYDMVNPIGLKKLLANGAKLRGFSPEIMEASFKAAKELHSEVSATNANFKKLHESLTSFSNNGYQWFQVAEVGYDNFMARHSQS